MTRMIMVIMVRMGVIVITVCWVMMRFILLSLLRVLVSMMAVV